LSLCFTRERWSGTTDYYFGECYLAATPIVLNWSEAAAKLEAKKLEATRPRLSKALAACT
jgi:hypothetical protein